MAIIIIILIEVLNLREVEAVLAICSRLGLWRTFFLSPKRCREKGIVEPPSSQQPLPQEHPPEGILHIRVPEAVDDWVQHGIYNSVKNSNSFILIGKFG